MRAAAAAIPRKRAPFFGRDREIAAVREALDGGAPLVTVTGPAGAGKTSTALELLRAGRETHPDVAPLFCELAEQTTEPGFVATVARRLGLAAVSREAELRDLVGAQLAREAYPLVVLDNFEQLPAAAVATLDGWIATAHEAQFVVTSRAPLRITGEVCVELPPLPVDDAAALFEERARAAGAPVPAASRAAVEALVHRLDGLPLAIELAAARADLMTPAQMLDELASRFELLVRDGAGGLGRHGSVRAAIRWSWDLVNEGQRAVVAELSAFRGSFSVEAASRVVTEPVAGGVHEALRALCRCSLLAGGSAEGGRFRLLESVRDFAALELSQRGAEQATWERHARWVAEHAERLARHHGVPSARHAAEAASRLEEILDDALAAHGRSRDPSLRIRIAAALHRYLEARGPTSTHLALSDAAVADAVAIGDRDLEAGARILRAELRSRCADIAAAEEDLAATASILAERPDAARASAASTVESYCQLCRRDPAAALASAERAIALEMEIQDTPGPARYRKAIALAILGRGDEAQRAGEEAVVRYSQAGLPWLEADARLALAKVFHHAGDRGSALLHYRAAARLHRTLGDRRGLVSVALNLGGVLDDAARFGLARRALGAAAALAAELGDRGQRAGALLRLGLLDLQTRAPRAAESHFAEVLATRDHVEDGARVSLASLGLGVAAAMRGDLAGATRHLEQAVETVGLAPAERVVAHAYAALVLGIAGHRQQAEAHTAHARAELPAGDQVRALLLELAEAVTGASEGFATRLAEAREHVRASFPGAAPAELRIADLLASLGDGRWRPASTAPPPAPPDLQVDVDGRWFARGQELVHLGRRRAARFVLAALVEARLQRPGVGLSADEVLARGWPGERVLHDAGQLRVRNVIRELRDLGLRDLLVTQDDGYLLGAAVGVERVARGGVQPAA